MSVAIETAEAIADGERFIKSLQDILDATEAADGGSNDAVGHNEKRSAANDGVNIVRSIIRRLGGVPLQAAPKPAPEPEAPAEAVLRQMDQLETVQEVLAEAATDPEASDVPPDTLADLFDPELTARQNQEALLKKYRETMSMREIHLSHNETSEAMECLRKAERLESGIKWNRARLAEVI